MNWLRGTSIRIACAFFAFFVITGDIVADAIHDASGACASETQGSDCDSCPACGCTVHTGSAIANDPVAVIAPKIPTTQWLRIVNQKPPAGPAVAIDHPPQLG